MVKPFNRKHNHLLGFSLIEILIVIGILGVLAAVVSVGVSGARAKGRDVKRQAELNTLAKSLEAYYINNGEYPTLGLEDTPIFLERDADINGEFTQAMKPDYLGSIPRDPLYNPNETIFENKYGYQYRRFDDGQSYELYAKKEKTTDSTNYYTVSSNKMGVIATSETPQEPGVPTLLVDFTVSTDSLNWQTSISGTAPLSDVDLQAIVTGGTATGPINYSFDCDITDEITDYEYNGSETTKEFQNGCSYPDAGSYTASVIVERDTAEPVYKSVPITVTAPSDNTPPIAGTVTPSNISYGSYVDTPFDLSTTFTDNESAVTSCEYTINGGTAWNPATVSGSGPYVCSQNNITTTDSTLLTLNMRATSSGGTTTASSVSRTADGLASTDGTLTATPGNQQISLSWTAATDSGSGLAPSNTYKLVFSTDSSPATNCTTGTQIYLGTALSYNHNGLTNDLTYYYRVCAYDAVNNVSIGATATTPLPSGLAGYWKFDEGTGITAYDSSGYGDSGTLTNGPVWTTGKINNALSFDGTNDLVAVPNAVSLNPTTAITIATWVKPAASATKEMFMKGSRSSNEAYEFFQSGTKIAWRLNNNAKTITSTNSLTLNAWNYITATYDKNLSSANMKIFINGVQDPTTENYTTAILINSSSFNIGAYPDGSYSFGGLIDEVRIYNRALSPAEITAIYNATK